MCRRELDAKYPQYQFAKHKGYGTKLHYQMLDQYGPCPEHRMTLSEKVGGQTPWVRPSSAGNRGEAAVARYLRQKGYTLLASQWRCRFGELDLVARDRRGHLCIVEVKLRGSGSIALPREFVDSRKQQRLRSAAELYLASERAGCTGPV